MKKLILIGLLLSQFAYSQRKDIEFGFVSKDEIEMKSYEKDKEAKAVILYDKGKSIFFDKDEGYDIRFTRHKRIKVFNKSSTDITEVSIPYYVDGYGRTEIVRTVEAYTFNFVDGLLTRKKLDPSTIYEERINERWHNKKFVFPDVQNGSILEYRYVLESPFHFNLPDWTFQDKFPTIYSEYQVSMIPFYEYVFQMQGTTRFHFQNSTVGKIKRSWGNVAKSYGQNVGGGVEFQDYIHTFVMSNVPAFKDESYISSINDYIMKMDFQLAKFHSPKGNTTEIISTWPALNKSLLKHTNFGKYIKSSSRVAKKLLSEKINLNGLNNDQKARQIIEYVKNNFDWNGYNGKYATQSAKDFFNNKSGNVADINLFMITLLNEAGINTEPLILSTRSHGKISSDYPFDHSTNYVVAHVNTNTPFLADGTENLLPFNRLPTRCINGKGLIVEKENTSKWISLENKANSLEKHKIELIIDTMTNDVLAKVSIQKTEYKSFIARKQFNNHSTDIENFYIGKIGDIYKTRTTGFEKRNLPYSIYFESKVESEKLNDYIVIKPLLNLPLKRNNLTQKKRTYPIDFVYPWETQFESSLVLPNGFSFIELPKDYHVNNELVEINLEYSSEKNNIDVKGNYKFKKSTYDPKEYSRVKIYLDQIVKYFNQQILIEQPSQN